MSAGFLIAFGTIFHIVVLGSIFDIYFTSPIVPGIAPVPNNIQALSKRVVVISVDGLRLDALLEDELPEKPVAPYIRWSMNHRGIWGMSRCHLPTESRPGHVAMLAGFYEDPSAVTKGWKENPVDFDSIFNQSACSFAWGSPDIINIFYKDLKHPCSYKFVFDEKQNFAGNTMELDNWVLNEVTDFLKKSGNASIFTREKSIFFLHLLGQDTSGHTHKPYTYKYRENLKNVDRIVREIDILFNQIFNDNSTTFVLTADHGMTDWGSHGAGDASETNVPLVAWGKGIRHPKDPEIINIEQADTTPLLALLIGSSIPVNSIGIIPLKYLNVSSSIEAQAIFLNARQILASFYAKRNELVTNSPMLVANHFDDKIFNNLLNEISLNLNSGQFSNAKFDSLKLINLALEGIKYYQNYFQSTLFALTTLSIVLWVILLILLLNGIDIFTKRQAYNVASIRVFSSFVHSFVFYQKLPLSYHAYVQIPITLAWLIYPHIPKLTKILTNVKNLSLFALFIFGIELLVLAFFKRAVLGINLLALNLYSLSTGKIDYNSNFKLISTWILSGTALAYFTILPVVGKEPYPALNLISSLIIALVNIMKSSNSWRCYYKTVIILLAGANSFWIHTSFINDSEVNPYNQYLSWALLAHLPYFMIEPYDDLVGGLTSIFSSLSIPFILLSVSHEGIFLIALFINLTCWQYVEMKNSDSFKNFVINYARPSLHNCVQLSDFRLAYIYLTFIYVAFFGIGNLATLNSFDPAWVRCFVTNFSPYTMTLLILFKVVIPFFAVTLAFRVVSIATYVNPIIVFTCVLIFCNIVGVNFLFLVRNEGSWLDIGISLSHYVIQHVATVFLLGLFALSQFLIPNDLMPSDDKLL